MKPGTALVTGASRGIGAAIAGSLADRGWSLILTARSEARLREVRDALPRPKTHRIVTGDLTNDDDLYRVVATTAAADPDLLVLNAGVAISASVEDTTPEDWDLSMRLNLRAPFLLVQGLLPALRASRGTIVAIGSVVSTMAYRDQAAYSAGKHGLHGFIKALAKEVHPEIRVHSIHPGGVATDMVRRMRPDIDPSDLIRPEDVATALVTLLDFPESAVVDELHLRRPGKAPWQHA